MIGSALTNELLNRGYDVIILTRSPEKYSNTSRLSYAKWDTEKQTIDGDAVTKADYIIHLAGEGIADKRWTLKRKRQIAESRIKSSALLVKALQENVNNVKAVVSASGIGWYGSLSLTLPGGRAQKKTLLTKMILLLKISWEQHAKNGRQVSILLFLLERDWLSFVRALC